MAEYQEPTFEEIFESLLTEAKSTMTKVKNWAVGGVIRSILGVLAKGLKALYVIVTSALDLAFYDTSKGEYLERIAVLHNRPKKKAGKLYGRVVYGRDETGDAVNIPSGAIVATTMTKDGVPLRYLTDGAFTLPLGELEVEVEVTSETVGARYNVGGGAVDVMVTPISGIDYVRNDQEPFWIDTEGTDDEEDEELQARLPLAWQELSFPAPYGKYASVARSFDGVKTVRVIINGPRGEGTVDVVITGSAGAPTSTLIAAVQAGIDLIKPDLADVLVKGPVMDGQDINVVIVKSPDGGQASQMKTIAENAIASLFLPSANSRAFQTGDDWSTGKIGAECRFMVPYLSNVSVFIGEFEGPDDYVLNSDALAQADTITVTIVGS